MSAGNVLPANQSVNKLDIGYLGGTLLAGAVGGLLFWVLATWTGTPMPKVFGLLTFLALMFIGSLSAVFGVYLPTASDVTAIRTYVFAIVCGLAWQPMIQAATRIATNAVATKQAATLNDKLNHVKSVAQSGNLQQVEMAIRDAVPAIQDALTISADLKDTSKKEQVTDASKEAIKVIQAAPVVPTSTTIDALKTISVTAAQFGETGVAIEGVQSLHSIGTQALERRDPQMGTSVSESLESIAAQSNDPAVKNAASASALQIRSSIRAVAAK